MFNNLNLVNDFYATAMKVTSFDAEFDSAANDNIFTDEKTIEKMSSGFFSSMHKRIGIHLNIRFE